MAFANYLFTGSYTIVDSVQYSKQGGLLRFSIRIYSNNTKSVELGSKSFDLIRQMTFRGIADKLSAPPVTPVPGKWYLVDADATGAWLNRDGLLATLNQDSEWTFWGVSPTEIFYDEQAEDYCVIDVSTQTKTVVYPLNDSRLWDLWFDSALMFSTESNIFKQCYLFLKSRAGFENVVDC